MSADLLAEFGQPVSSADGDDKKVYELSRMTPQDNKVLIPNISDPSDHATPPGKKDNLHRDLWRKDGNGADVLFDASADQYDLNDECGKFEHGEQESVPGQPANTLHNSASKEISPASAVKRQSLLDLEGSINPPEQSKGSESQHFEDEWGDFSTPVPKEEPKRSNVGVLIGASGHPQAPTIDETAEKEEWEPFEDGEATTSIPYTHSAQPLTSRGIHQPGFESTSQPRDSSLIERASTVPPKDESRPTNIPPPAILLQILPKVFRSLADVNYAQDNLHYYGAILQAYTVASHLIAGRTLRWKRDNILSQSTKIGPAAAGGKGGGMKLAALNKSESLKEEREVADVIQAWETHAHLFNSKVHKAGIGHPLMMLSERSKPRPEKRAGVLTSQYACALCGLKRDERMPEVDINIDDSFGEFWIEHWGHRECKDFWYKNQALLQQR